MLFYYLHTIYFMNEDIDFCFVYFKFNAVGVITLLLGTMDKGIWEGDSTDEVKTTWLDVDVCVGCVFMYLAEF